jgi:hypothetical protein
MTMPCSVRLVRGIFASRHDFDSVILSEVAGRVWERRISNVGGLVSGAPFVSGDPSLTNPPTTLAQDDERKVLGGLVSSVPLW